MVQIADKIVYEAFGFTMISEIHLPELTRCTNNSKLKDIEIRRQDLSKEWKELPKLHNKFVITDDVIMFQIENLAIFSIRNGNSITVSPLNEYDEDLVRLYILGSCMGVILIQRKILPLHGSTVAIDGKAYAIVGDSGAGKSTLASAFIERGFQLLTDDVIAVTLNSDQVPFVTPSYPQQKLWQESLDHFGMDSNNYCPISNRETKYTVPVIEGYSNEPLQLAGIFELVKSESENIELLKFNKLESLNTLYRHTFRYPLIADLNLFGWHFDFSTKISVYSNMYQLRRPYKGKGFTAPQLVNLILETIEKEHKL
ncbi:aldolase [Neobacillus sp. D3-1R]|uniref:aldolase n=1 Tax=Neobacillus sp. D3-1R TaxID=3445778 RepID=UPI003FA13645